EITKADLDGGALEAAAVVTLVYDKDGFVNKVKAKVELSEKCLATPSSPPPSSSPPAPPPGPPAPPPAPPAAPPAPPAALPKTGDNTGLFIGAALLLAAIGTGLYLLARRRRIKFVA